MSTVNASSIPHSPDRRGTPPSRPAVRIFMVLRLFAGILVDFWRLRWVFRMYGPAVGEARLEPMMRRQAVRFRETAEIMGGLIVKVGQFLSSRLDLLPKVFVQELQTLQDHVRVAPWPEVRAILEEELGPLDEAFLAFDTTPMASASLGQVYSATAWDGRPLAVKVQRPHIEQIVQADLRALRIVVTLTSRLTNLDRTFDLGRLLAEFRRTVYEELDYVAEAHNLERVRRDTQDLSQLRIPRVHPDHSTKRVLTMERLDGVKISDVDDLTAMGVSRQALAERVIHLYLHMVMDSGFFHADPHPGNLLVQPDGTLVLLDFGMVGQLSPAVRRQIRRLFVGLSERRPGVVVDSLLALGVLHPEADRRRLRSRVAYLLERYYAETLQDMRQTDVESLLADVEQVIREEPIQFPAQFAFLGRAVSMLVGVATHLDPTVNLVSLFAPYARRFVTQDAGGTAGYALGRARDWGQSLTALPPMLARVLHRVEDGELEGTVRWPDGEQALKGLEARLDAVAGAIYTVGLIALGIWLTTLGWTLSALLAWAAAAARLGWRGLRRRR
jgi:predicted unusual protein kinase regulating ubiquinone biosynthesis (AarF/ABC1/UbiB family)